MIKEIQSALQRLHEQKPLVLCLTNQVSIEFVANSLLAVGALPLMSDSIEELDDLLAISQGLVINLGTLNRDFLSGAEYAAKKAQALKIPIVLDPVGAGASQLRTQASQQIIPYASIVRGNASEIMALAGVNVQTRGVDSAHAVAAAETAADALAYNRIIMVSGETDYICHHQQHCHIPFGSSLMPLVTGMGCALTAVIAAFATITNDLYKATCIAGNYFALCGQVVAQRCKVPGSFKQAFIDQLFQPDWHEMQRLVGEI